MKVENYKEWFQECADDYGYTLKSDAQLIKQISKFGAGETEFHTIDIERIIMEKQTLYSLLNKINEGILINSTVVKNALEYYKP